jgi:hypothetical protein
MPVIRKKASPVEWAGIMYELEDAQEHLTALIFEMNAAGEFHEADLRIQLGYVFSHLNHAWHRQDKPDGLNQGERQDDSRFPIDLDPAQGRLHRINPRSKADCQVMHTAGSPWQTLLLQPAELE